MVVVTPSKWLAGLVKQSYLGEYTVEIINNGIDMTTFKKEKGDIKKRLGIEDKKMILGVASEWTERKGLHDFVKLEKEIERICDDYRIVMVGLNESQIASLPRNIIGLKRTSNVQELVELYSEADFFFNPTYEDNYPTTNLEAAACGSLVITYDSGGSPETIVNGKGQVVKKGDIHAVIEIILKAADDRKNVSVPERLSKKNMIDRYIELYKSLYGDVSSYASESFIY